MRAYWKQCAELGTGFVHRYRSDPFFRTEANIIGTLTLFSLTFVTLMGAGLTLLYQSTLTLIVARIQESILKGPPENTAVLFVPRFDDLQSTTLFVIIVAGIGMMIAFAYFIIRIALAPARSALSSQKQFIGNIAHELRTPLATIKLNTEVALLDGIEQPLKEILESNVEELDRISEIINNLLSLNTLVRPAGFEFSNVDLGTVTQKTIQALALLSKKRGVQTSIRLSDFRVVWGNESALEQIATNIIKNAITYSPRGGQISVTVEPDYKGSITLVVEDSGSGIAEKDLFKIFEPFYRGSTSREREDGGSGLGLAIVSELTRLHHGKILVRSAPRKGTTVLVSFPAGKTPHDNSKEQPEKNLRGEIIVDFSTKAKKE